METLTEEQQKRFEDRLLTLANRGIEVGKVIELWKDSRYYVSNTSLNPEEDAKNADHYVKYQDQFGVFHSALLFESHCPTVTEILAKPDGLGYVAVTIWAKEDNMWFHFCDDDHSHNWFQTTEQTIGNSFCGSFLCLADFAYNTTTLTLNKNGQRPVPRDPIVICQKHDFAYHKNEFCERCHNPNRKFLLFPDLDKPKLNPVSVSVLNKGIYTLK